MTPLERRWAVAPFSPVSPFRVYAGTEHEPISATTRSMVTAARTAGDPQFDAIVAVKARPILVLKENAAIVTALHRLPVSAIDTSEEHGTLNANELRGIHERVARAHGLKLDLLALAQARRLIDRLRSREP